MTDSDTGGRDGHGHREHDGPRVVALAVDGMEPSLLDRWVEADELPDLRSLREDGAYGTADCSSLSSANQWTRD